MSAQFQTLYPTANLISELLQIYAGKFVALPPGVCLADSKMPAYQAA